MKCKQLMAMGLSVAMIAAGSTVGYTEEAGSEAQISVVAEETAAPVAEEAPPATEAPAPPATEAPAPPATEAPAPPATEAPAPETSAPETAAPETQAPATEAPATEQPSETTPESSSESAETSGTESESSGTELTTEAAGTEDSGLGELETDTELETETESETDDLIEDESEVTISNDELIARQNIVVPPDISLEYRFSQVDKVYGVVKNAAGTVIREEQSEDSAEVGKIDYYGICYILADADQDWIYVESGNVRGFIQASELVTGDTAERLIRVKGETSLPVAILTKARSENAAFTYTQTTVYPVLASKNYAVAKTALEIHEARQDSAAVTGTLEEGGLLYILADVDQDWIYVESSNARGFVKASELITGTDASVMVTEKGEEDMVQATVEIEPADNKACYYTLTSVKAASQAALTRTAMVNFSLQFLGNPYVWGGTSLTNGCDCSGFVQSIYAYFGYSLPRVAESQAVYGMQIPIASAEPGDLIFYAKNGYVYHVSMYIGDGRVIQAANKNSGIITSGIGGSAVWATRVISD